MNGFPAIDPHAAKRAERQAQAAEQVKLWTNAMKENRVSACMFHLELPLVDGAMLFLGAVDTELRAQGYEIGSHSHTMVGTSGNRPVFNFTFIVRATGDSAPRVMLA